MNEDALEQFNKERLAKHIRGIKEHRGGDASAVFSGDPVGEYCEEQLDSVNYLEMDYAAGRISWAEYEYQALRHFEAWWWRRSRG